MKINENTNSSILTNDNLKVLDMLKEYRIIDSINELKNIKENFVVFNDVIRYLKDKDKKILFDRLEKSNTHFINITSDIEEVLLSPYLIIIDNGNVLMEGNTEMVLKEEKILKRLGFGLPFIVDLSTQLMHYNLINDIYLSEEELINKLW